MNSFRFSKTALTPEQYRALLADPACGGYASFEGWVRDNNEGKRVLRLEYEAFEELGVKEGERIVAEAMQRFGVRRAACVHRVGELAIGELAVWVGVSAGHRAEAFDACRCADLEEGTLRGRRLGLGELRALCRGGTRPRPRAPSPARQGLT